MWRSWSAMFAVFWSDLSAWSNLIRNNVMCFIFSPDLFLCIFDSRLLTDAQITLLSLTLKWLSDILSCCWRQLIFSFMFPERCVRVTDKICSNMSSSVPSRTEVVAVFMCTDLWGKMSVYCCQRCGQECSIFASGFLGKHFLRKGYFSF